MKKISKFLATIGLFFKTVFGKEFDFLKKNSGIAVKVTEAFKGFVESPVADFITAMIPGEADDAVKVALRNHLPKIAAKLALAHAIVQQSTHHHDMVAAIIDHLKTLHPDGRAAFWLQFSGEVNYALADGKISFAEAVAMAQIVYAEIQKNK